MNKLIAYIMAIQSYNKDIHYSVHGNNFYGDHIFVDKFEFDYIDDIKEVCLLGKGERPLRSVEYLSMAIDLIPEKYNDDDNKNFELLQNLIGETLLHIENMQNLTKGEENLIGAISQDLQQYYGLINLRNMV